MPEKSECSSSGEIPSYVSELRDAVNEYIEVLRLPTAAAAITHNEHDGLHITRIGDAETGIIVVHTVHQHPSGQMAIVRTLDPALAMGYEESRYVVHDGIQRFVDTAVDLHKSVALFTDSIKSRIEQYMQRQNDQVILQEMGVLGLRA